MEKETVNIAVEVVKKAAVLCVCTLTTALINAYGVKPANKGFTEKSNQLFNRAKNKIRGN